MAQRETRFGTAVSSRALRYLPATALIVDAAIIVNVSSLAAVARERLPFFTGATDVTSTLTLAGPLMAAAWLLAIAVVGGYSRSLLEAGTDEFRKVATATLVAAGIIATGCYLLSFPLSRGYFFVGFALGLPGLMLGRLGLRQIVVSARRHGTLLHNVLIVGGSSAADDVAAVLRRERRLGYKVLGALVPGTTEPGTETATGIPVLGDASSLTDQVLASGADIVFFVDGGLTSSAQMRRLAWDLEHHAVQVVVAPSVSEVAGDRVRIRPVGGLPLIHIDPPRALEASRWGKRVLDVVGSSLLLLAASPVMAYAALRIKLHDGGPILFRQTRTGQHGAEFGLLKFRTMVTDAEALLAKLHAENGYDGGLFKMEHDPRITKPGRWLRRFSIDELPQLVNVLRGEMSLVGPRPPLPLEVAQYEGDTARRLRVRPGLTGLWQVSGRSNLSWEEAIRLDLYYVDNWSMFQDLSILLKTVNAVVASRGAY